MIFSQREFLLIEGAYKENKSRLPSPLVTASRKGSLDGDF
jgi:hypothetical protein